MAPLGRKLNGSICPQIHKRRIRRRPIRTLAVHAHAPAVQRDRKLGRHSRGELIARRMQSRFGNRPAIQRFTDEFAGADIVAARGFLATLAKFQEGASPAGGHV